MIPYRLILSGTPVAKDEIDLWSQYRLLNPAIWGKHFTTFADACLKEVDMGGYRIYKPIKKKLKPFMKRAERFTYRVKLDDMVDMPGRIDVPVYLEMKGQQKKDYYALQENFIVEHGKKRASIDLSVVGMSRLHQIAGGHLVLENNDVIRYRDQPKLWWLLDKIEDLGDKKLIVFCRYTLEIELIVAALKMKKVKYVVMKGKMTQQQTSKVRKQFQKDPNIQVLIGQIQCVKEGNNFQHCRYNVFYSKSFSSVDLDQCKKRTWRNGQKRKVVYWHLIMKNSIDEDYETVLRRKTTNAEKILLSLVMKRSNKCLPKRLK